MLKMRILSIFLLTLPLLQYTESLASFDRDLEWWETTVFYQIYARSFMDSDGDGIGDLNGITSKLEYLKELGVGATWISPIFQSPMYDFGYDIADFYSIHEEYGTMEDFEKLIQKANELEIKVILDFVPNHTSNESVWFEKALKGNEKYYNYFIWEDGVLDQNNTLQPPNNWISVFGKSAWEYRKEIGKFYFHQFVIGQPDLNYRNPDVVEEMKNVLRFWFDKGIAGFRIGAISHLFEVDKRLHNGKYPDEPRSGNLDVGPDNYNYLNHIYTKNQNDTFEILYQWRNIFDEYKTKDGFSRVMMTEVYSSPQNVIRYFGNEDNKGSDIPMNFDLIMDVRGSSSAAEIKYAIDKFITFKPIDKVANWVIGNHDYSRVSKRYGSELVDGMNMLLLLLPGVAVTYMGEEIGMVDGHVSWEETLDPNACNTDDPINYWIFSRDPNRTPFQWNASKNAGFSSANKTWLPVADGYKVLNVDNQQTTDRSHLNVYKSLVSLRNKEVFIKGRFKSVALNDDVYAFKRWRGNNVYIVIVNMRDAVHTIDLTYFENVVGKLEIIVESIQSPKNIGEIYEAHSVPVFAKEAIVFKLLN